MIDKRILIISHNALSEMNNMGKTIGSYFRLFDTNNVAQLYLHEGLPNSPFCNKYYEFTDKDAIKSILDRRIVGREITKEYSISENNVIKSSKIYSIGRKKMPVISFARDIIWLMSNIYNKSLLKWVDSFSPDLILFASGDSIFSYKIALKISKYFRKPLICCCYDDFIINSLHSKEILGKIYHKRLTKISKLTFNKSSLLFCNNELMANEYSEYFNKKFYVLYNASDSLPFVDFISKEGISYLGGISLNRNIQLVNIGKSLASNPNPLCPKCINVYSSETDDELLNVLIHSDGVDFKGTISPSEVKKVICNSLAVVHVESFDEKIALRTRLSFSTKIAESLASHSLILAYGPKHIASMQYLLNNSAAIVSDNIDELVKLFIDTISNKEKYESIVSNAYLLYLKNHSPEAVSKNFTNIIEKVIYKYEDNTN